METRNKKKKASVTFANEDEIKHIITRLGERPILRLQNGTPRSKKPCYKEDIDSYEDASSDSGDGIAEKKSTVLCNDSEVTGRDMFGFSPTPRKGRLSLKVKESIELKSRTTPRRVADNKSDAASVVSSDGSSLFMTPSRRSARTPLISDESPVNTPRSSQRQRAARHTPRSSRKLESDDDVDTSKRQTPSTATRSSQRLAATPKSDVKTQSHKKAALTPRSSQRSKPSLSTPKSARKPAELEDVAKTPFNVRRRFQQKITKKMLTEELGLSSDSEFNISDSEIDSDSSDQDDEVKEEEEEEEEPEKEEKKSVPLKQPIRKQTATNREQMEELKYVIDSEEFFRMDKCKSHTSSHTLSRLRNAHLPATSLALAVGPHGPHIGRLLADQQDRYYQRWRFALAQGFSVLVYGAGSKRQLLDEFRREALTDCPVVVCNGFFPSLTIKELCDAILEAVGCSTRRATSDSAMIELVERALRKYRVALIVHNLDGPCIRSRRFQELVARLAGSNNVNLLASVDHINAPIMWDQSMLSQYNFTYWDATSLQPYTEETSYEGSLLMQRSGALMLSSLNNVFRSLTTNAQGIYLVIVKYQLTLSKADKKTGMPFKQLYRRCREELLVSSDLILRSQLTEFLDHKLVTCKRGAGGEVLHIPLADPLLQAFLQDREQEA